MISIFNEWVLHDVGSTFVQTFDNILSSFLGHPAGICTVEKTCGRGLVLESNGDVYLCDHFVTPDNLIGNINAQPLVEIYNLASRVKFGQDKWNTLTEKCKKCPVLKMCFGGCPKDPDGHSKKRAS